MSQLKNKNRKSDRMIPDINDSMELYYREVRDKQVLDTVESLNTLKEHEMAQEFITKDSGQRQEFSTGMKRDVQKGKPRYDLLDMPMLKRWAELMARGAEKYGEENWRKAATEEELKRFKASAIRHMYQWLEGDYTEDHASAVYFNIAGAEMVKEKLKKQYDCEPPLTDEEITHMVNMESQDDD
jgi:hypothetical protein